MKWFKRFLNIIAVIYIYQFPKFGVLKDIQKQHRIQTQNDSGQIKERLKQRENFWVLTLETLIPKGLNQELVQIIKLETKNIPREQPPGRN